MIHTNINNGLFISCNTFISSQNITLFNRSLATVIVIGIPADRMASVASSHLRYRNIHVLTYYALNHLPSLPVDLPNGKPLAAASSTLVHSHHWLSDKQ